MSASPQTFAELFAFYNDYVKLLYSDVQTDATLPVEVLFEINAAFDHVSRFYIYNENEKVVVEKAYSHLKRSCLDIFKLKMKHTTDEYNKMLTLDIGIIDNGEFERNLHHLYHGAKQGAIDARQLEGRPGEDDESAVPSFELWQAVYDKCVTLQNDYFLSPKVDWAKVHSSKVDKKSFVVGVIASLVAGAVLWSLTGGWLTSLYTGLKSIFN